MAKNDLRSFLELAKKNGELLEVNKQLSPIFEPCAVLAKLAKEDRYPAVMFNKVGSGEYPVLSNLFANRKRLALALGCEEKNLNAHYRTREDKRIEPVLVDKSDAPVQEIVWKGDEVDLYKLPILKHNELDAAPYVTCGARATPRPASGTSASTATCSTAKTSSASTWRK